MAKFNFYLREKKKDSETPILLFISFNGQRVKYPTGKTIHPKFWNEETQQARQVKDFPTAKIFNSNLKFIQDTAFKIFEDLTFRLERNPFPTEIKTELDRELKDLHQNTSTDPENKPTFMGLFKRFIHESEQGLRLTASGKRFDKRSIQKYNTVYDKLEQFGKRYHLTFETIDQNFYTKFVNYLNKEKYSLNNVGKYIQVIKTFLTYATENGYNTNMFFQSRQFKAHKVAGFSIYLNENEVNDLYELDLSSTPHLERVRDLFIVGCWTGLRFSDFTNIQPKNIEGDFLKITTYKTGEKVIIPIHRTVKEIMAKYKDRYPNSLPPAIANQKMNAYLKDIAKQVDSLKTGVEVEGIKGGLKVNTIKQKWELVTTHTARRSFATNVYKSGFPAISLMKITGHKTEKAFLLYIKVTPEENAQKLLEHWNKSVLKVS
ncbi:site-specific integrase [Cecembia rubra]|uniref:Site-specific recombinase XerD n=1 Tax=Cecembia rubra TaxID=1485585 RepID=A0A2P8DXH1_9BACT|nr:site-specific integrase [Cecembia rubra]PSL01915.1 site-specific recombinase XerD [Cecembia rubra]